MEKMKIIRHLCVVSVLVITSIAFARPSKRVSGIVVFKSEKAVLHLNSLSRSAILVELQNPGAIKNVMNRDNYFGPADLKIKIVRGIGTSEVQAKILSFAKRTAKTKLPYYDRQLSIVQAQ
jgi:hypothetical protein